MFFPDCAAWKCDLWPRKWRSLSLIVTRSILSTLRTWCKGLRLACDSSYGNPRSNSYPLRRSDYFGTQRLLLRAIFAVAQILMRREVVEPRESEELLCSKNEISPSEEFCFFIIDKKHHSCDFDFSEDFFESPAL